LVDDEIFRPLNLIFNEDGTKMYVLQTTTYAHINEFDLGIPYDILTATYNSRALNVNPQTGKYIQDIGYNYDGTKLFVMNSGGIYEYDLGDPYDIATAVYNSVALSFGQQVSSFMFDDTGNSLYTLMGPASWRVDERIFKYKLAEPSMFAETVSNDGSVEGDLSVIISQDTFNDPNNEDAIKIAIDTNNDNTIATIELQTLNFELSQVSINIISIRIQNQPSLSCNLQLISILSAPQGIMIESSIYVFEYKKFK
jgi:hypothetical protein